MSSQSILPYNSHANDVDDTPSRPSCNRKQTDYPGMVPQSPDCRRRSVIDQTPSKRKHKDKTYDGVPNTDKPESDTSIVSMRSKGKHTKKVVSQSKSRTSKTSKNVTGQPTPSDDHISTNVTKRVLQADSDDEVVFVAK
ncbi:uncharacterized protein MELLADRAFT_115265, partial [Melampsora larici-populina 98AG31]